STNLPGEKEVLQLEGAFLNWPQSRAADGALPLPGENDRRPWTPELFRPAGAHRHRRRLEALPQPETRPLQEPARLRRVRIRALHRESGHIHQPGPHHAPGGTVPPARIENRSGVPLAGRQASESITSSSTFFGGRVFS